MVGHHSTLNELYVVLFVDSKNQFCVLITTERELCIFGKHTVCMFLENLRGMFEEVQMAVFYETINLHVYQAIDTLIHCIIGKGSKHRSHYQEG